MKNTSPLSMRLLLGAILASATAAYAISQQPQPVPVTNDTPAATA